MTKLCRACRNGHLHPSTYEQTFNLPDGGTFVLELLTRRCDTCGETNTDPIQHRENLRIIMDCKELEHLFRHQT